MFPIQSWNIQEHENKHNKNIIKFIYLLDFLGKSANIFCIYLQKTGRTETSKIMASKKTESIYTQTLTLLSQCQKGRELHWQFQSLHLWPSSKRPIKLLWRKLLKLNAANNKVSEINSLINQQNIFISPYFSLALVKERRKW